MFISYKTLCRGLLKKHWLGQNGGRIRFPFVAAAIVALSLIACNGPNESASGTGPEHTLIETPEYTGVIVSENGASEFSYLFDQDSTRFWEPSITDISKAEECIRQFLVSVQHDPR